MPANHGTPPNGGRGAAATAEQALAKAVQAPGNALANTEDGCRAKDPAHCPTHGTGKEVTHKRQSVVKSLLNKAKDSVHQAVAGNAKYRNIKNSMEAGIHRDFIGKMGKNMDISASNLHRDCGLSKDASKNCSVPWLPI